MKLLLKLINFIVCKLYLNKIESYKTKQEKEGWHRKSGIISNIFEHLVYSRHNAKYAIYSILLYPHNSLT